MLNDSWRNVKLSKSETLFKPIKPRYSVESVKCVCACVPVLFLLVFTRLLDFLSRTLSLSLPLSKRHISKTLLQGFCTLTHKRAYSL